MKNIFTVLNDLENKPELYLGNQKLSCLYHFMNGYLLKCVNVDDNDSMRFREFHIWIKNKLNSPKNNWCEIILEDSNYNEKKALKKFFDYIVEFKIDKNIPLN